VWGIEDSSRNWSALMTLEHLVIVDRGIQAIVQRLTGGKPYPQEVRIADMKPRQELDASVIDEFTRVVDAYLEAAAGWPDLHTRLKHAHPWFGPMDAHEWHSLAALHHGIHRRQVEAIVRELRSGTI
jgi:hypothetical protein